MTLFEVHYTTTCTRCNTELHSDDKHEINDFMYLTNAHALKCPMCRALLPRGKITVKALKGTTRVTP